MIWSGAVGLVLLYFAWDRWREADEWTGPALKGTAAPVVPLLAPNERPCVFYQTYLSTGEEREQVYRQRDYYNRNYYRLRVRRYTHWSDTPAQGVGAFVLRTDQGLCLVSPGGALRLTLGWERVWDVDHFGNRTVRHVRRLTEGETVWVLGQPGGLLDLMSSTVLPQAVAGALNAETAYLSMPCYFGEAAVTTIPPRQVEQGLRNEAYGFGFAACLLLFGPLLMG